MRNFWNFNYDNLLEHIDELVSYVDGKLSDFGTEVKKYDVTTDEGYRAFIEKLADLRIHLNKQQGAVSGWFRDNLVATLDRLAADATSVYDDAKRKLAEVKEDVAAAVDEKQNKQPIHESHSKTKKQNPSGISKLVNRYMEEVIKPQSVANDEQYEIYANVLTDFAEWVIKH